MYSVSSRTDRGTDALLQHIIHTSIRSADVPWESAWWLALAFTECTVCEERECLILLTPYWNYCRLGHLYARSYMPFFTHLHYLAQCRPRYIFVKWVSGWIHEGNRHRLWYLVLWARSWLSNLLAKWLGKRTCGLIKSGPILQSWFWGLKEIRHRVPSTVPVIQF